jgi:hypothetical protein
VSATGRARRGLIGTVARYALDAGYHVVVEGILHADHYGEMSDRLMTDHRGATSAHYLHVPFAETLIRHAAKPVEMRGWYRELGLLAGRVRWRACPVTAAMHSKSWPRWSRTGPRSSAVLRAPGPRGRRCDVDKAPRGRVHRCSVADGNSPKRPR